VNNTKETVTFEGLAPKDGGLQWLSPHGGFTWTNFGVLDKGGLSGDVDGYAAAVHGSGVASTAVGEISSFSSSVDFSLKSGHFAAAWNTGMTVTFTAYRDGTQVAQQTFTVDQTDVMLKFNQDFRHIDAVTIESSGGTHGTGFGDGTQLAMDNLRVVFDGDIPQDQVQDQGHGSIHHVDPGMAAELANMHGMVHGVQLHNLPLMFC